MTKIEKKSKHSISYRKSEADSMSQIYDFETTPTHDLFKPNLDANSPTNLDSGKSLLDTKGTLLHFSKNQQGSKHQKKLYNSTKGRKINLYLAENLASHKKSQNPIISKQIRLLRFCSKLTIIQQNWIDEVEPVKVSHRCRSSHCAICRKLKSGKLIGRLKAAIEDEENKDRFEDKKFYMLTLTVKHNEETRKGNYLKEFREYSAKLRRSKLYKNTFDGSITSIENVIGETEYHIHSHSLVVGNLERPVLEVQGDFSKKWLKITKDSKIVHIRLADAEKGAIEVLKYSTKLSDIKKLRGKKLDMYVNWIIETQGQNFVNCSGIFRGLEITGRYSKYDEGYEKAGICEQGINFGVRTAKLKFNFSTTSKVKDKDKFKKTIHLKKLDEWTISFEANKEEIKEIEEDFKYCHSLADLQFYVNEATKKGTLSNAVINPTDNEESVPF